MELLEDLKEELLHVSVIVLGIHFPCKRNEPKTLQTFTSVLQTPLQCFPSCFVAKNQLFFKYKNSKLSHGLNLSQIQ